jgi:hypothetical protein
MPDLKHVGRTVGKHRKCVIAYRVIPNDPENCLVVFTDNLEAADHDSLINLVESNSAQNSYELAEAMARTTLVDGRNMLSGLSYMGKLTKISTKEIELTPNNVTSVNLAELNEIVAQQKGVTVADLALKPTGSSEPAPVEAAPDVVPAQALAETVGEPLSDDALAAQLRSQADAMFKEAKRLREQAEELAPTKKKTIKTAESA